MRSLTGGEARRAVAACAACALWLGFAGAPAKANDDGAAPLWVGIGSIFGFGGKEQDPIEYRDHAKLVLPPNTTLPAPGGGNVQGNAAWPRDPDIEKRKKEKAEHDNYRFVPIHMRPPPTSTADSKVTIDATAGQGPSERSCVKGPGENCTSHNSPSIDWNPLTWVGLQKKAPTELSGEPDRDWLTDPPKGYREPAEGVGVKIDN
ncbi:MAG: hypothetical protein JO107_03635 [Hyphomicrobiales bacterium]|nr:hypothetical protein [Hyphomicrobiales bacterium]MBV8662174.1 hypothetical protein [Hyphomicrobiales bacterium]